MGRNFQTKNQHPGIVIKILYCLVCMMFTSGCGSEKEMDKKLPTPPLSSPALNRPPETKARPSGTLPSFRTVGAEAGFDFERFDDIGKLHRILEVNGGGVALFDFDRDGLLDVFMTNGCRLPLKTDDRSSPSEFFRNRGEMQFERITNQSLITQLGFATGCAVGDYNADGFDDLYVTAFGRNALWHNNGDGTFSDLTDKTGTHVPQWSSSAAFADINGDGHLDLYVVNYLEESDESPKLCPNPGSPDGYAQCTPASFEGVDDVLFLSDGKGHFVDATATSGMAGLRGKGLDVVIGDLDGDIRPEIYVANDGQANFLFVHDPDAPGDERDSSSHPDRGGVKFVERALSSGVALNDSGYAQASMGIAVGDYDANGTMDLFLTHFFGDTNTFYTNRGRLLFEDATRRSNLAASSRRMLGFGTASLDVDNDGWLDLIVANGNIDDRTWSSNGEPYRMRPQMYRNERNGSFSDISNWSGDYFAREWLGRGVAVGDLDRDGKVDAVVSHQLAPSVAIRNETPSDNASLNIRLVGTSSNRSGYGARVEVTDSSSTLVRELVGGGGFQSASAPEIHLGLGKNKTASIRIQWPSGLVDTQVQIAPGTWVAIEGEDLKKLFNKVDLFEK